MTHQNRHLQAVFPSPQSHIHLTIRSRRAPTHKHTATIAWGATSRYSADNRQFPTTAEVSIPYGFQIRCINETVGPAGIRWGDEAVLNTETFYPLLFRFNQGRITGGRGRSRGINGWEKELSKTAALLEITRHPPNRRKRKNEIHRCVHPPVFLLYGSRRSSPRPL